jgi:predicted secreted protein
MKLNAARAGMVRRGASLLGMLSLLASPALAGDRALVDIIGYSPSGQFFAFEEFGIQDGSGFAYSSIYIVDLLADSWVVGTPLREQADDEGVSLSQIRAEVQLQAAPDLKGFGIEVPAEYVALIGDGAPDDDGKALRFGAPGFEPGAVSGDYQLRLSTFPTTAASPCQEWFSVDPLGYQLAISDGTDERVIHRDSALPRSRGCPATYRLYGVVMPFNAGSASDAVALISVYPGGFEGPNRRFLAVPLGL